MSNLYKEIEPTIDIEQINCNVKDVLHLTCEEGYVLIFIIKFFKNLLNLCRDRTCENQQKYKDIVDKYFIIKVNFIEQSNINLSKLYYVITIFREVFNIFSEKYNNQKIYKNIRKYIDNFSKHIFIFSENKDVHFKKNINKHNFDNNNECISININNICINKKYNKSKKSYLSAHCKSHIKKN
jgi:hypothetical protein